METAYTTAKDSSGNSTSLNTTQTNYSFSTISSSYFKNTEFHTMIFGTETGYWLASRCVTCSSDWASFSLFNVHYAGFGGSEVFRSNVRHNSLNDKYFRPVVSLGSSVSVDISTGNGTAGSMYTIVEK